MVFQSYALYSHLTVYENLAYPLRVRKLAKAEIDRRVRDVAEVVQIGELLNRKPRELSGGQRQRVALGRAIIRRPAVFSWTSRSRTSTPSCASTRGAS